MNTIATEKAADAMLVIDATAKRYAAERTELSRRVAAFNIALDKLRANHLPLIRDSVACCADLQSHLEAQIDARRDLFVKPRTVTLHGIKLGIVKGKGKLIIDNAAKLVERIRAQFSKAKADALIKVKQTPVKKALQNLPADELKKLGISIIGSGDAVFIEAADSEVDKLVAQLLDVGSKAIDEEAA